MRRGKSQPWVRENFYPLTNCEFQTPICKPWEVKFPIFYCLKKNPSKYPDIWGGQSQPKSESFWKTSSIIPTFEGRFVNPEAITFLSSYISGHLEGQNLTLLGYKIVRWCLWSSPSGCPNHCLNYIKDRLKTPEQIWCNFAIFVSNLTQLHDSINFPKKERAPTLDLQIQCRCFLFWYRGQENGHGIFLASIAKWRHISQNLGNLPNPPLVLHNRNIHRFIWTGGSLF